MSGPAIIRGILALTALVCAAVLGVMSWGIIRVSAPGEVYADGGILILGVIIGATAVCLIGASIVLIRSVLKSGHENLTNV